MSFGNEFAGGNQTATVLDINQQQRAVDRFIGYIVFAGRGHQTIIEVMMLIINTGESVKFFRK